MYLLSLLYAALAVSQSLPDIVPGIPVGSIEGSGSALQLANSSQILIRRQTLQCPASAPIDCGATGCCPAGDRCCPNGCCGATDTCFPDGCCPEGSNTCGGKLCLAAGESCCGDLGCRAGYSCQTAVSGGIGCCQTGTGQIACDATYCCQAGQTCIGNGLCRKSEESTSTETQRSTVVSVGVSTATSFKMTYSTSYYTETRTSFGLSETTYTTTGTSTSFSSLCTPTIGAQASDSDSALQQLCNGIPVMFFPLIQGYTEELIDSMCNAGLGDQTVLTWAGDGEAGRRKRAARVGCKGYCANLGQSYSTKYGGVNHCDEYPFASSLEGGTKDTHKQCIYYKQNLRGGSFIQNYARLYQLKPNQQFLVKIVPGCPSTSRKRSPADTWHQFIDAAFPQSPALVLDKRQSASYTVTNSSDGFELDQRPGSNNGSGIVIAPMSDVPGGQQVSINLNALGSTRYVVVTDGDGTEYFYSENPTDTISFNLSGEADDTTNLGIIAAYAHSSQATNITYTATGTPAAATASGQASGGGSVSYGSSLRPSMLSLLVACIAFVLVGNLLSH